MNRKGWVLKMAKGPLTMDKAQVSTVYSPVEDIPPGYKRTEVGVIPEDWDVDRIDGHTRIRTGAKNTQDRIEDGEYPFFVRSQEVERINSYSYEGEAVLTAGDGVGTGKVFHYINGRFDVHQRVYRISDFSDRLDSRYFFYQFSTRFYDRIMSMTAKSSVDSVRMEMIAGMQIPLPLPAEQHAIAEALSDADTLLAALDKLIAKKRAIKQAAMQQLLTGKTRLPGFSGEWENIVLGEHVTFLRTGVNSRAELTNDGSVKYLHYGDIHTSNQVRLDPRVTAMPSLPEERARTLDRLRNGDLVFVDASEDLDGVGKSVEISGVSDAEIVSGLHTIAARFNKSVLADGFKAYLQFCPAFREQLKRLAAGTKVFAISRTHIASVELRLPDTKEQTTIATVLSDMDAELAALERRRDKTRQIKQGMMQELLTGRTRLVP
jgi:type I restriction enzyme, S subunit